MKPRPTDARLEALDRDPALVARWPLDGNLEDVSGNRHPLVPMKEPASFIDEGRVYNRSLSPGEIKILADPHGVLPEKIRAVGGHHDAGDYNSRSHLDVAQALMTAYEMAPQKFFDGQCNIPERQNGIPDILDEAAWALRLWRDLQDEDGGVFNGTESAGDPNFIQTVEQDPCGDYTYAKDAQGSFLFAGAMAQASRIWKRLGRAKEAADFLDRARRAYEWGMEHPPTGPVTSAIFAAFFLSPKAYAAAELLHTTGEADYNTDFLASAVWSKRPQSELEVYGLYDQQLAAWAYVNCPVARVDAAVQKAVRDAIIRQADLFIRHSSTMAYSFVRHPWAPITWGTGAYANWLKTTLWAWKLTGDQKYRYWMVRTCDNILGANPMGISWIVGLGTRTVRAPLHNSRYSHLGEVVDGVHVEGLNERGEGYRVEETAYPRLNPKMASLYTFVDTHFAISMDEPMVSTEANTLAAFGLLLPDQ